jgi:hypothetical protein
MRLLATIGLVAVLACPWATAHAAMNCNLSGSWRANNGDTLTLSGIDSSRGEGTFSFRSAFMTDFTLNGGYRIVANQLQMRGRDSGGRSRDISLEILGADANSFTTKGNNKIDDRPQIWTRTAPGC